MPRSVEPLPPRQNLTIAEAAAMLGKSVSYTRRLAQEGRLPTPENNCAFRLGGRGQWVVMAKRFREAVGG